MGSLFLFSFCFQLFLIIWSHLLPSADWVEFDPRFFCHFWWCNPGFGIGAHQISLSSFPPHSPFRTGVSVTTDFPVNWSQCLRPWKRPLFEGVIFAKLSLPRRLPFETSLEKFVWSCHKHPLGVKFNSVSSAPFSISQIFIFAILSHFHIQTCGGVEWQCNWLRDYFGKLTSKFSQSRGLDLRYLSTLSQLSSLHFTAVFSTPYMQSKTTGSRILFLQNNQGTPVYCHRQDLPNITHLRRKWTYFLYTSWLWVIDKCLTPSAVRF